MDINSCSVVFIFIVVVKSFAKNTFLVELLDQFRSLGLTNTRWGRGKRKHNFNNENWLYILRPRTGTRTHARTHKVFCRCFTNTTDWHLTGSEGLTDERMIFFFEREKISGEKKCFFWNRQFNQVEIKVKITNYFIRTVMNVLIHFQALKKITTIGRNVGD